MPCYDDVAFHPPAAIARCLLHDPMTDHSIDDVPMLIDTGADVSLVPQSALDQMGTIPVPETFYELLAFDESKSVASVVEIELRFTGRTFRGRFLVLEQPTGIIGRNVLNALPLLLDGPNLTWEIHSPS